LGSVILSAAKDLCARWRHGCAGACTRRRI